MRVLVLSSVFPNKIKPNLGVFVKERVRHVAQHCEIIVVAPVAWFPLNRWIRGYKGSDLPLVEEREGLRVYHPRFLCVPGIGKCFDGLLYFVSLVVFIYLLRQRFPFDLIDAHFSYPDGFGGVLLGRVFHCPVLITLRGTHDIRHAGYRLRYPQIRFALKSAAEIICVSESLRSFALSLGIKEDRVRVILNGIDQACFSPSDRNAGRARLGLPCDATILLAVGAMIEGKGHHRVIECLPNLVSKHRRLLFIALGDDEVDPGYRGLLQKLIKQHRLQEHVRLVPARPHSEIPLWMNSANLFCLATRSEGRCNAILEALACGLPVVSTEVGGNDELVHDARNGFLVPFWNKSLFTEALSRALDQSWDLEMIARDAHANTWEGTARQLANEFRRVAKTTSNAKCAR